MRTRSGIAVAAAAASWTVVSGAAPHRSVDPVTAWGAYGHEIAAQVAVERLPVDMPGFFRAAGPQLAYLNPEPDRWRDAGRPEMNEAFRYDHYVDLERVPDEAIAARDRFSFIDALYAAGIEDPQANVGFLPFHIVELHQRLTNGFQRWRAETDPERRAWIEDRIVNDAGILGHFVTDASNPHHSTVHFDGWNEELAANPGGVTTARGFHARFEADFVAAHVTRRHLQTRVPARPTRISDVRNAVWALIRDSNGHVLELYEIDRDFGFRSGQPPRPEAVAFAADRLALGAAYLRDLWWSAWVESGAR